MRVVAALGGNALLRRGEPLTAEAQRHNARAAARAIAPVAGEHELVISHGNGPQVGLLALQGTAYADVEAYPLDVLDAETEGMIGYILQQELGTERPPPRRIFGLETVRWLLERGAVVVCSGGGGVPVAYTDEHVPGGRRLVGVEAVVDKDLASALLASEIH